MPPMFKKHALNTLIILLIAALAVGGAFMFERSKQRPAQSGQPLLPASHAFAEQVVIPDIMQTCSNGESCIVVDTTCSFCCKYMAINAKHEALFNEMFDGNCQHFTGTACSCFDLSSYPKCIQGKCQLVKWDDEEKQAPLTPHAPSLPQR